MNSPFVFGKVASGDKFTDREDEQKKLSENIASHINFLKALCDEVQRLSAAETLQRYRLGTSGNVNRIKAALVSKEIIDIAQDKIEFIDPLFKLWFSRIYMK